MYSDVYIADSETSKNIFTRLQIQIQMNELNQKSPALLGLIGYEIYSKGYRDINFRISFSTNSLFSCHRTDNGRRICRNVASLKILVYDVINLLS